MTRFIVLAQSGAFVVHDNEDGSDSTPMNRYSSAVHLAKQWNSQAAQELSFAAIEASANAEARAIMRGVQQ
jgi:imidazole glycerol phosphate synthase subunit HisF